jgi:hypothetical protein
VAGDENRLGILKFSGRLPVDCLSNCGVVTFSSPNRLTPVMPWSVLKGRLTPPCPLNANGSSLVLGFGVAAGFMNGAMFRFVGIRFPNPGPWSTPVLVWPAAAV